MGRAAEHNFRGRMAQSALAYISTVENLRDVWREFLARSGRKSSAGSDWIRPEQFELDLQRRLSDISEKMRTGYKFAPLRGVVLPKEGNKTRLICIPTVADRLVQRAVLRKVEAKAERLGIVNDVSFGFVRPPSGAKRGTHAAREAAVRLRAEYPWVLKADIAAFFDTINRHQLVGEWSRKFSLKSLAPLVLGAISCEVLPDSDRIRKSISQNSIRRGVGLRQGMPLSPILSNFVLKDFDRRVSCGRQMVRYADDMMLFGKSQAECDDAQAVVSEELIKLGLSLSIRKTQIYGPQDAVGFLGMELGPKDGGGYALTVSRQQLDEIRMAFTSRHDWRDAHGQKMTVADLFVRLEQMKRGYLTAYSSAENKQLIEEKLTRWTSNCASKVYSSIFGEDRVAALDKDKRAFLMLP
jgi:RNA-directed DNA polymerase